MAFHVASDSSMSAWMSYVYQQQPAPTNFTGVPVQIAVLDSNGNHYVIGTAITTMSRHLQLNIYSYNSQATSLSSQLSLALTVTTDHPQRIPSLLHQLQPLQRQPLHQ